MELRMTTDLQAVLPQEIGFNFDELKTELAERLDHYNNLVVTEDTIKDGKAERANLSKLRDAIESRRKQIKKQYLQPYNDFESRIKELVGLVDQPIRAIDTQLAAYEDQRKKEKQAAIEMKYIECVPEEIRDIIPLRRIADPKWLNATTTMKKIESDLTGWAQRVQADIVALGTVPDEYAAAVRTKYIETLDVAAALSHQNALRAAAEAFAKKDPPKEEKSAQEAPVAQHEEPAQEAPAVQEAEQEPIYRLRLEFHLTMQQANELKRFLANNGIEYNKI